MLTTVPAGEYANDVNLDPLSNLIFVTDGHGNQVLEVDGSTNQVIATVPLSGSFPVGVAPNPVTRAVYITEFFSNQVEIMTER